MSIMAQSAALGFICNDRAGPADSVLLAAVIFVGEPPMLTTDDPAAWPRKARRS
jgi:hypothetical protein